MQRKKKETGKEKKSQEIKETNFNHHNKNLVIHNKKEEKNHCDYFFPFPFNNIPVTYFPVVFAMLCRAPPRPTPQPVLPAPSSTSGQGGGRGRGRGVAGGPRSESEEYDSLQSDTDTEHATSSRTESSIHLDSATLETHHASLHLPLDPHLATLEAPPPRPDQGHVPSRGGACKASTNRNMHHSESPGGVVALVGSLA